MEQVLAFFNWEILISAIITTFVVSAINTLQNKLSTNWLVFIVSIVITVLEVEFDFSDWQGFFLQVFVLMSFAILFYNYIGKWFVDRVFSKLKEKFGGEKI